KLFSAEAWEHPVAPLPFVSNYIYRSAECQGTSVSFRRKPMGLAWVRRKLPCSSLGFFANRVTDSVQIAADSFELLLQSLVLILAAANETGVRGDRIRNASDRAIQFVLE